jgi:cell wall-associated NlpC family hydrolase
VKATALVAVSAVVAALVTFVVLPSAGQADPPPNPTNQQISAAQAAKDQLGTQVGTLSAQVTSLQAQLDHLRQSAELAEQKVALSIQQLQKAQEAAAAAQTQVKQAQDEIDAAQLNFTKFIRSSYTGGPDVGTTGDLLVASDPESLLQHSDYVQYTAAHQISAIGDLNKASIAKSNADAAARSAVITEQAAEKADEVAKAAADAAAQAAAAQTQQVQASLSAAQTQLQTAQSNLATLNGQRAAYDAYVAQQAAIAAAAAAAAAAARAASQHQGSGNGGGVAVGPGSIGHWTAAAGQTAVNRAMSYIHWPYSFAAGNFNGPTYGVAVDFDSRNDAHVYGFDCSGLALYAWAPYIHMDHYAATQYLQAGSVHPNVASLLPGDLVFWSDDGTRSGIGHVAIYIGGGNVIQAPFSGAYIEITPLNQVESGYYGATRPLT